MPLNEAADISKTRMIESIIDKIKPSPQPRVVAILAVYNESRFIRGCIENLVGQGVYVYVIDNCSTDQTLEIVKEYRRRGLVGLETFPRSEGVYRWQAILERKEELARKLKADWLMHVDADEIHLPPRADQTLVGALAEAEEAGYNAVDFQEFVFVPTRESPDHDHPNYQKTMRWYYPFTPSSKPRLIRAWKRQSESVGISNSGGHKPDFPGMELYPVKFPMKHYPFLSARHVLEKYGNRNFEKEEIERGWHGWRARLREEFILLPSREELKTHTPGLNLDPSNPRKQHVAANWAVPRTQSVAPCPADTESSDRRVRVTNVEVPSEWLNREGYEEYAVRWHWQEGFSNPGFTAVLRVKDEARSLPFVLPAMLRSVRRVIVMDNNSTDGTPEVARALAEQAGLSERLEVLSYPFEVSRCGPEHLWTHPDSVHSLTYYYNYSFSQVRSRYALKWDGDMVLTPQGERVLKDLAWQMEGIEGTVKMRRSSVYVESDRVAYVDLASAHGELWGWSNTSDHTFIKCFDWETVRPWSDYLIQMPDWASFELKWLDGDQFSHWTHTDFQEGHHRKRREWEVNRALLEGGEPPEGIVKVKSPDGTHIIEHLRQNYVVLRRYGTVAPVSGIQPGGENGKMTA